MFCFSPGLSHVWCPDFVCWSHRYFSGLHHSSQDWSLWRGWSPICWQVKSHGDLIESTFYRTCHVQSTDSCTHVLVAATLSVSTVLWMSASWLELCSSVWEAPPWLWVLCCLPLPKITPKKNCICSRSSRSGWPIFTQQLVSARLVLVSLTGWNPRATTARQQHKDKGQNILLLLWKHR